MSSSKSFILGITGGSGSGKTLLIDKLKNTFKEGDICFMSQDDYYRPWDQQVKDDNGWINFDLPESIDHAAFARDIETLRLGQEVIIQEYQFNLTQNPPRQKLLKPSPLIVVEGIFVFYHAAIEQLLDLKVFVEAHTYLMLKRRIERDLSERGYSLEEILYMFDNHVMPAYREVIEPLKHNADLIIPNNTNFDRGALVLEQYLQQKLHSQ